MLADIQVNAEYIAYAITIVAEASRKNNGTTECAPPTLFPAYESLTLDSYQTRFPLMAWSQGNLAISWALTFWPSTRQYIGRYISFAGDYGGCDPLPSSRLETRITNDSWLFSVSYTDVVNPDTLTRRQAGLATNAPSVIQQLKPSNCAPIQSF